MNPDFQETNENNRDRHRRQHMLRLLVMFTLFLLLFDGSPNNSKPKSSTTMVPKEEILLPSSYLSNINSIVKAQHITPALLNVSGIYRGSWDFPKGSNDGNLVMQLRSISLKNVEDLSFVYGLVKLTDAKAVRPVAQLGFPVQGMYLASKQKLVLFSSLLKNQRLFLQTINKVIATDIANDNDNKNASLSTTLVAENHVMSNDTSKYHRRLLIADSICDTLNNRQSTTSLTVSMLQNIKKGFVQALKYASGHILNKLNVNIFERSFNHAHDDIGVVDIRAEEGDNNNVFDLHTTAMHYANQFDDATTVDHMNIRRLLLDSTSINNVSISINHNNNMTLSQLPITIHSMEYNSALLTEFTSKGALRLVLLDENTNTLSQDVVNVDKILSKKVNIQLLKSKKTHDDNNSGQKQQQQQQSDSESSNNSGDNSIVDNNIMYLTNEEEYNGYQQFYHNIYNSSDNTYEYRVTSVAVIGEAVLTPRYKAVQYSNLASYQKLSSSNMYCQYQMNFKPQTKQETEGDGGNSNIQVAKQQQVNSVDPLQPITSDLSSLHSNGNNNNDKKLKPTHKISGNIISHEDCKMSNVTIASTSHSLEMDVLSRKVTIYSLIVIMLILAQIVLVVVQLRHGATQASNTKLSILGIEFQSILDAMLCMGHLILGSNIPDVFFTLFMWISVLLLILFSVLHMRLIIVIYQARYAQELAATGWQGLRSRLITLHLRFYGALFVILFCSLVIPMRSEVFIIMLYSFWIPQIIYNAYHGTKHTFHWLYLIGMTTIRCFIPLYIFGCPKNFIILLMEYNSPISEHPMTTSLTSYSTCILLIVWLTTQLLILYLQRVYGSRFFIPKRFLPAQYDYYRPIPRSLANAASNDTNNNNHNSGNIEMNNRNSNSSNNLRDVEANRHQHSGLECVICYNDIYPTQGAHMVTPCDHVFHEACLQQWIRVKLECPICRATLPPLADDDINNNNSDSL